MGEKLNSVLTWVERFASAISIAVPAFRDVVAVFASTKPEVIQIDEDL